MKLLFSHDLYVISFDEFRDPGWTLYGKRYRILSCLKIFVNWTGSFTRNALECSDLWSEMKSAKVGFSHCLIELISMRLEKSLLSQ